MKVKPLVPRAVASEDIEEVIAYYLGEDAGQAALGFVDALERAFSHIGRHPGTGSSRYAHELNIPGLRCWPLARYPHLIFYADRGDHIDVWRVLHGRRDIPAWLERSDPTETDLAG